MLAVGVDGRNDDAAADPAERDRIRRGGAGFEIGDEARGGAVANMEFGAARRQRRHEIDLAVERAELFGRGADDVGRRRCP